MPFSYPKKHYEFVPAMWSVKRVPQPTDMTVEAPEDDSSQYKCTDNSMRAYSKSPMKLPVVPPHNKMME